MHTPVVATIRSRKNLFPHTRSTFLVVWQCGFEAIAQHAFSSLLLYSVTKGFIATDSVMPHKSIQLVALNVGLCTIGRKAYHTKQGAALYLWVAFNFLTNSHVK